MIEKEIITDHAVVRFIERHDRMDLSRIRRACGGALAPDQMILACLNDHGINIADVRGRMMTDTLRTAVGMGAAAVRMGRVRLMISGGRVVTVKPTGWDRFSPRRYGTRFPGRASPARSHNYGEWR